MKHAYLYNDLVRFYYRSRKKFQRLLAEGKNQRKQDILQRRLVRLFKKLTCLQRTLKLGMATAAMSAGILIFQPDAAQAQAITFKGPNFGLSSVGYLSSPSFADLDGDGDLDMMSGEYYGSFFYFENTGTSADPVYGAAVTNPFGLTDNGFYSSPAFADLDGDGDLDMMSGEYYGSFFYFENTGTAANPFYAAPATDPFGLSYVGYLSSPAFADLDADGDFDLMSGELSVSFFYFENTGTATNPVYTAAVTNPFGLADIGYATSPTFADLDDDGDLDMLSGEYSGSFFYFENTGTAANPAFAAAATNPFGLTDISFYSSPAIADLDADGDLDLMSGLNYGNFLYFRNDGTSANAAYAESVTNPFALPDIGNLSSPAFADLDADGDLDMMSGEFSGSFFYFENTGTAAVAVYAAAVTNPFSLASIGLYSSPAFADLDADGDLDMMSGEQYGGFLYFENTGTAAIPAYDAAVTNPFGLAAISYYSSPCFADLDADGDLDIMSGELYGSFFYFENTGTAANPAYAAAVTTPFGLPDIGNYSSPAFADLDTDGDLDLMSGEYYGSFFYFENTGTAANPVYAAPAINPFNLWDVSNVSSPAFADLDADGDLDLMSGLQYGGFFYFENTSGCNGVTVFADGDGDGFGDAANSLFVADCIVPAGYVMNNTDCNDADDAIHPGVTEVCNGVDENCNALIDEGVLITFYADADADTYGNASVTTLACSAPSGYVPNNTDCNDVDDAIHPGATEVCNTVDDNCNAQVDEGLLITFYADADADTYGNASATTLACSQPGGYVTNSSDCNDADDAIHPGATEVCNTVDDNCNAQVDEGLLITFYADADGDTYGDAAATTLACSQPGGYVTDNTDCDDTNPNVNPGVLEVPNNGIDDNCNGQTDEFGVGIDEPNGLGSFNLFPNPATDQVTIQFEMDVAMQVAVKVNDLSGKEIIAVINDQLQPGEHALQLNTAALVKGVYIVNIRCGNGMEKNVKLVVQ